VTSEKSTGEITQIGVREEAQTSGFHEGDFLSLHRRAEDDPMNLYNDVRRALENSFLNHNVTYISSQLEALGDVAERVLSATPGSVTAVPLVPGGGKSTLIRSLLAAFAAAFKEPTTPIAARLGGVIVIVEKSSEAHELERLCNSEAGEKVATVVESPNDYNLRNGCPNGTATRYEECLRRACPDYSTCPLVQAANKTEETPILILLHARYQRHMEDMAPFLTWCCGEEVYHRTLLLVDELPNMLDGSSLCITTLNEAEAELDQLKASYRWEQRIAKQEILYLWNRHVRTPFFTLSRQLQKQRTRCGLVSEEMRAAAGFLENDLRSLQEKLMAYADHTKAEQIVDALLSGDYMYHSTDQTFATFVPRLKEIDTAFQLAVFLFSGSARLSPEVVSNPTVDLLTGASFEESYSRLSIFVQRGDGFSASKTALESSKNREGVLEWLRSILPQLIRRHKKILLVTYQSIAEWLWRQLPEYHGTLIPYLDSEDKPTGKLPYFGGMNGSNRYQEATAVICVGLNRFEPREYLNRALALDHTGETAHEMVAAAQEGRAVSYSQIPGVRAMEDITLACDIVQLVFRSALRKHGEQEPIELWLLHTPDGVLQHLKQYFGDCRIETIPELPESCRRLATAAREYRGAKTHASVLLRCLEQCSQGEITPAELREQTGLTQSQYKEALRNEVVRTFLHDHFEVFGSGKNTRYRVKAPSPATAQPSTLYKEEIICPVT